MIARQRVHVYGCDRETGMLDAARKEEGKSKLGINFQEADITQPLPYSDGSFDAVSCVAVLMHDSPEECRRFLLEAYRVLKQGGRMMISVTHPELSDHAVKFRAEENEWVRHESVGEPNESGSRMFKEFYRNREGEIFESVVWAHPVAFLRAAVTEAGFKVEKDQTIPVTAEALAAAGQKGRTGYPAFYQILAVKSEH